MPMFESNVAKMILVFLISIWVIGCSSVPENELTDIDNVITEKQKKAAQDQSRAAQEARNSSSKTKTAVSSDQPVYPLIPAAPVMQPVTTPPNPVVVANKTKEPSE